MKLKNKTVILKNIIYCTKYSVNYQIDSRDEINKKLEEGYNVKDIKISSTGEIAESSYQANGEKKAIIIEIYILTKEELSL